MSQMNLTFETKHGHAVVATEDVVSLEDIDERTCAVTVRHPGDQVFKHYSIEKASELYDRIKDVPKIQSSFIERRGVVNDA